MVQLAGPRPYLTASIPAIILLMTLIAGQGAGAQIAPPCGDIAQATISLWSAATDPIEPISGIETIPIEYSYMAPTQAFSLHPVALHFDVMGHPSWANVVLSHQTVFIEVATESETVVQGTIDLTVSVDHRAPAYERHAFIIGAYATEGTCVSSAHNQVSSEITAGFYERWNAQIKPHSVQAAVGETVDLEAIIENQGNGAIEVRLLKEDPLHVGQLHLPKGLHTVGSQQQGNENLAKIPLEYTGTYVGRQTITLEILGASADNQDIKLTPTTHTLILETVEGNGNEIGELPAPTVPIFLIGALGAALLARRR
jgi:hypothetical protein